MTQTTIRIAKMVISVISAGLTFMAKQNSDNILDEKIAKKVAEEFVKRQL